METDNIIYIDDYRDIPILGTIPEYTEDAVCFLASDISSELADILISEGFDLSDSKMSDDYSIIMEMIKAMIYRQYDTEHPFHDFLDSITVLPFPNN